MYPILHHMALCILLDTENKILTLKKILFYFMHKFMFGYIVKQLRFYNSYTFIDEKYMKWNTIGVFSRYKPIHDILNFFFFQLDSCTLGTWACLQGGTDGFWRHLFIQPRFLVREVWEILLYLHWPCFYTGACHCETWWRLEGGTGYWAW